MVKKYFKKVCVVISVLILSFLFDPLGYTDLETELLVDLSPTTGSVNYLKTQWYGFSANTGKGYCVILTPLAGNSDLYLLDNNFNRVGYSKNSGTTVDKAWYGQATTGPFHIACFGNYNPSSNFTIQVITAPYLKTMSPATGPSGTLVTLTGFGFGATRGTSFVQFGSVQATQYSSWSNTQIKVYVPAGVSNGVIQAIVYVASKASNPVNFTSNNLTSNGTMWRYDLARTANYLNGPTAFPLSLKWSYNMGYTQNCYPALLVANNTVYLNSDKFYALDATTGALKWSYVTGWNTDDDNVPSLAGNIVYFGVANIFYALDANTGSLKWKYTMPSGENSFSSPAVANGMVYFFSRGIYSPASKLYVLDANTGTLKWSYIVPEVVGCSPTIANNVVYFGRTKIYALDGTNGSVKWIYSLPANKFINDTMAFSNGILYFGATDIVAGGAVYAIDTTTLSIKWTNIYGHYHNPAVADGRVYCYGDQIALEVVDANTGQRLWSDDHLGSSSVCPTVSQGTVFIGDSIKWTFDSRLYAFDAVTGAVKWNYDFSNMSIITPPEIANGKVYFCVTPNDGSGYIYVYCFGQ